MEAGNRTALRGFRIELGFGYVRFKTIETVGISHQLGNHTSAPAQFISVTTITFRLSPLGAFSMHPPPRD